MPIQTRMVRSAPPGVIGKDGKTGKAGKEGTQGTPGTPGAGGGGGVSAFLDLGSGATFELDFALASWFRVAPSGAFTFTIANPPAAGEAASVIVEVVAADGAACTLPAGGSWGGLGPPEFSPDVELLSVGMRNGESESFWALAFPGNMA